MCRLAGACEEYEGGFGMDVYVKAVLTVIAACLLLQVAQGFGVAGASGPQSTEAISSPNANSYVVQVIPPARMVLRFDRATGRTWTMPMQRGKAWEPIDEATREPLVLEEGEAPPPEPGEAGGAGN